jgi:hypothetical protein
MPNTTNFGWATPADTDLVKDGAAAIRTLGSSIDTSLVDLKGGTTGQVLTKASNTDLDFNFTSPLSNPLTTTGDIIYSSSGSTAARLGIGTATQILAVNSGATAPEWVAAPASGSLTLIASGSLSGSTVTISSIPGTYKDLRLYVLNWSASGNGDLVWKINNTTANTFYYIASSNNGDNYTGTGGSGIRLSSSSVPSGDTFNQGCLQILDYANTSAYKSIIGNSITGRVSSPNYTESFFGGGGYASNSAVTSIVLDPESTNTFDNGTYALYGIN